jgi:hypothetical protein
LPLTAIRGYGVNRLLEAEKIYIIQKHYRLYAENRPLDSLARNLAPKRRFFGGITKERREIPENVVSDSLAGTTLETSFFWRDNL